MIETSLFLTRSVYCLISFEKYCIVLWNTAILTLMNNMDFNFDYLFYKITASFGKVTLSKIAENHLRSSLDRWHRIQEIFWFQRNFVNIKSKCLSVNMWKLAIVNRCVKKWHVSCMYVCMYVCMWTFGFNWEVIDAEIKWTGEAWRRGQCSRKKEKMIGEKIQFLETIFCRKN